MNSKHTICGGSRTEKFTQAMLKNLHIRTGSIYKMQDVLLILQLNLIQKPQVDLQLGAH
jgi:hypothetical protein